MARPPKYSPAVVDRIVRAVELGATYRLAAAYGGITYETFRVWRETKPAFSAAVRDAEGRGAVTLLIRIRQEADGGDWRAATWILERRHPDDYGKTVQQHNVVLSDAMALRRMAEELAKEAGVSFEEALAAVERAAAEGVR